MKYYTSTIPLLLAEKLKEKGMPIDLVQHDVQGMIYADYAVTYAGVIDFLIEKGIRVYVVWNPLTLNWHGDVNSDITTQYYNSWHEAAEKAIEKALTLI